MSVGEKVDQTVEFTQKHPVYSGLTALFGTAALASNSPVAAVAVFASPFVTAINTAIGAVGLVKKDRGLLSKAFSGAAVASGVASGLVLADTAGAPGWAPLMGYLATSAGMVASAAFNAGAHYTRNVGRNIGVEIKIKDKEQEEPVFKSVRTKNETPEEQAPTVGEP